MDELLGRMLGPYRVDAIIGQGGMGAVFRATHLGLQQARAVKIMSPRLAADPRFVERFRREAKVAASLRHPKIVLIYDVAEQDGLHYIVMDLVEGRTLRDVLTADGALALPRALGLLRQLASALDYAHAQRVIHRDIKPGNVLVGPGDLVTLVDFGIARAAEATGLTAAGAMVGTPSYMAPEMVSAGEVGPSTDLYALGVLAYELLTGRVPFTGSSPISVATAHVETPPPSPRLYRPDLPGWVEGPLLRQLAKNPAERYPSAESFVAALSAGEPTALIRRAAERPPAVEKAPAAAPGRRPDPLDERSATVLLPGPRAAAPPPTPPPPRRKRFALTNLAPLDFLPIVLIVGLALFWLAQTVQLPGPRPPADPGSSSQAGSTGGVVAPTPPVLGGAATATPAAAPTATAQTAAPTAPLAAAPAATIAPLSPTAAPAPPTAAPAPPTATAPTGPAVAPKPSPSPAAPALRTVYDERFANNQRGWPNDPNGTAFLRDGAYRLLGRNPGRHVAVGAPLAEPFRDVVVSGTFRKLSGPSGGGGGLIVRDQGPFPRDGLSQGGRYYVFEAGDRGEWGIWRRDTDRWVDLVPWTPSPAVRPGLAVNELTVRAVGPRLSFLVNGTQVASLDDASLADGRVGVYLGGDLNELAVERFTVQVPE